MIMLMSTVNINNEAVLCSYTIPWEDAQRNGEQPVALGQTVLSSPCQLVSKLPEADVSRQGMRLLPSQLYFQCTVNQGSWLAYVDDTPKLRGIPKVLCDQPAAATRARDQMRESHLRSNGMR